MAYEPDAKMQEKYDDFSCEPKDAIKMQMLIEQYKILYQEIALLGERRWKQHTIFTSIIAAVAVATSKLENNNNYALFFCFTLAVISLIWLMLHAHLIKKLRSRLELIGLVENYLPIRVYSVWKSKAEKSLAEKSSPQKSLTEKSLAEKYEHILTKLETSTVESILIVFVFITSIVVALFLN